MTAIISNTGPLIALDRIDGLKLLPGLYTRILIPEAVAQELLAGRNDTQRLETSLRNGPMEVVPLANRPDPLLQAILDEGEASVIQLAKERGIDKVLIDERKGRKVARDIYGLKTIGTVRILLDAKHVGLLKSIKEPLSEMLEQGYRLHKNIIEAALIQAGER
jgi:uncharacterized protein